MLRLVRLAEASAASEYLSRLRRALLSIFSQANVHIEVTASEITKWLMSLLLKVRIANPESRGLYTLRVQCKEKASKIEDSLPPGLYRIRAGVDYNRGEAVAAAARSQDRRIDAANKIKAFFLDRFGPSSTSSGSGSESGSDDDVDDDDDVAAPAPAGGRASARLPFRCHRRGAAVRLPSSSEDSD